MSNKPSVNTALKTIWEYMGLISDYRKPKAIEAFNKLKEELKTSKQKHGNLEKENKRLKEALESIAKGMEINPPNSQVESVVRYFVGFAEAALKGNSV